MTRLAGRFGTAAGRCRHVTGTDLAGTTWAVLVMPDRRSVSLPWPPSLGPRSRSGLRALARLTVAVAALTGCNSALAATTPQPPGASYLFSIPTASGSLTGHNNHHLTLRLTGTRDYLTLFTDRPPGQAFVVANVDFAQRFKTYFATSDPTAVLTYTPTRGQIPISVVLTVGQPRWEAATTPGRSRSPGSANSLTTSPAPPSTSNPQSFLAPATSPAPRS